MQEEDRIVRQLRELEKQKTDEKRFTVSWKWKFSWEKLVDKILRRDS